MKQMKLSVGVSDFEKIRSDGYYYIDKSGWIKGLLKSGAEVTLLTRPRRFGKTLGMSMLANFFDITKDNRALFEGLEIMKDTELCQHWMNQYPVLFLSFKDVDGTSFENALALLQFTLSQFCDVYAYLEDGDGSSKSHFSSIKDANRFSGGYTKCFVSHYEDDVGLLWEESYFAIG